MFREGCQGILENYHCPSFIKPIISTEVLDFPEQCVANLIKCLLIALQCTEIVSYRVLAEVRAVQNTKSGFTGKSSFG